jgi:tetratricopeptide (TPR) repeat protein
MELTSSGGKGDILITSRHRGLEEIGTIIDIPPMWDKAGVTLLLHRYQGINVNDYLLEGSQIVNRLGGLALAIDQASAYMAYTHLPIDKLSDFLAQYEARRKKVLRHTTDHFWKYMKLEDEKGRETAVNAFTTWEMSFQQLLNKWNTPDSVGHFLTLAAFLGPIHLSESLFKFHWQLSEPSPDWSAMFMDSCDSDEERSSSDSEDVDSHGHVTDDLSQAVHHAGMERSKEAWDTGRFWYLILQAYQMSLLQSISPAKELQGATFLLHPLIRDWLQLRIRSKEREIYTHEAINLIVSSIRFFSHMESDARIKQSILLHMDATLLIVKEFLKDGHRLGQDIVSCDRASWFAFFYGDQGRFKASLDLRRTEMETRVRAQGKEHPSTLTSMNNLALVLRNQGKYPEAEQIHRKVVEVSERVLGKEHPDTLTGMNNLATVLTDQGKYPEAEQMYREELEVSERVLGKEHPSTLTGMSNLALVLRDQGKYPEAEQMYREELELSERVQGKEHPDTLTSMNNLATVLRNQGKYPEAEQMYREVVEVSERVLGKEHPSTLTGMNNLASVLGDQGQYEKAAESQAVVVVGIVRILGLEHPNSLTCIGSMLAIWESQGIEESARRVALLELVGSAVNRTIRPH